MLFYFNVYKMGLLKQNLRTRRQIVFYFEGGLVGQMSKVIQTEGVFWEQKAALLHTVNFTWTHFQACSFDSFWIFWKCEKPWMRTKSMQSCRCVQKCPVMVVLTTPSLHWTSNTIQHAIKNISFLCWISEACFFFISINFHLSV